METIRYQKSNHTIQIENNGNYLYEVDLDREENMLFWFKHLKQKTWMSSELLQKFLDLFILHRKKTLPEIKKLIAELKGSSGSMIFQNSPKLTDEDRETLLDAYNKLLLIEKKL